MVTFSSSQLVVLLSSLLLVRSSSQFSARYSQLAASCTFQLAILSSQSSQLSARLCSVLLCSTLLYVSIQFNSCQIADSNATLSSFLPKGLLTCLTLSCNRTEIVPVLTNCYIFPANSDKSCHSSSSSVTAIHFLDATHSYNAHTTHTHNRFNRLDLRCALLQTISQYFFPYTLQI